MLKLVLSKCGNFVNFINAEPKISLSTITAGDFSNLNPRKHHIIEQCMQHMEAQTFLHMIPNHGTIISPFDAFLKSNEIIDADSIIYSDYEKGCLALVHCSYITLSRQIIEKSINDLRTWSLLRPDKLKAVIYSGICQDCYEVDTDVYELFKKIIKQNKELDKYFKNGRKNHFQLDLAGFIKEVLSRIGLAPENIQTADICSLCMRKHHLEPKNSDERLFYSYRKFKDKKRNLIFAKLPHDSTMLSGTTGNCPYVVLSSII